MNYPKSSVSLRNNFSKVIFIISTVLFYVLFYPIYVFLVYYRYIDSDRGLGFILHGIYIPLGYLEQKSQMLYSFLSWLSGLLIG